MRSVAARFGLLAAVGELATAYEILRWPEGEAIRAAGACFSRWLAARGHGGAAEDAQALEAVRAFIAAHGASRFELVGEGAPADQRIINRAGFRRADEGGGWVYLILPTVWRSEVCGGLDPARVAWVLAERGCLLGWTARHPAAPVTIPGHKKMRLYCVPSSILAEGGGDE